MCKSIIVNEKVNEKVFVKVDVDVNVISVMLA